MKDSSLLLVLGSLLAAALFLPGASAASEIRRSRPFSAEDSRTPIFRSQERVW